MGLMAQALKKIAVANQQLTLKVEEPWTIAPLTWERATIEQLENHYTQRPYIYLPAFV